MENCSNLEAWVYRPAFPETCWISEAFARDNEVLTKALQISLSSASSPDTLSAASSSLLPQVFKSEPAVSTAFDSEPKRARVPPPCPPSSKIAKRKSRASKRSTTTYISADPANFRQMVQQVTGLRLGAPGLPAEAVLRPEPQRPGAALQQNCLPTLDTSAFLLDRSVAGSGGLGAVAEAPVFDFDPFTMLESWGVM